MLQLKDGSRGHVLVDGISWSTGRVGIENEVMIVLVMMYNQFTNRVW